MSASKICIIGAGTSGVVCAKVLLQHGLNVDVYEKGSGIGGIWRFQNDNGMSTCYRSLHINTSKYMMELSDYKFRDSTPEFPNHWEILDEFERYVDEFNVRPHIQFNTSVEHCSRLDDGRWKVQIKDKHGPQTKVYEHLVVANGHHSFPRYAELPGEFSGEQFHAHHYVDAETPINMRGKKVVVIGVGNSAMDIACELSRVGQGADAVYLSQRTGVWILPKMYGNILPDVLYRHPAKKPSILEVIRRELIPRSLRIFFKDKFIELLTVLIAGHPKRMGLKSPESNFSSRQPTVSQEIFTRLMHGDIKPKGSIKAVSGNHITFEDDSEVQADVIIHATGYKIQFPFFDESLVSAKDNNIVMWQRMFDPRFDNLAFITLLQPVCAMMPIAEIQSEFLADYLCGELELPSKDEMERQMVSYDKMMKKMYMKSQSYTVQIDCDEYTYNLRKAWKKARLNANKGKSSTELGLEVMR